MQIASTTGTVFADVDSRQPRSGFFATALSKRRQKHLQARSWGGSYFRPIEISATQYVYIHPRHWLTGTVGRP